MREHVAGFLSLEVRKLVGQRIVIACHGHAEDFEGVRLAEDGSSAVNVLLPELVQVLGMLRPVGSWILVMHDVGILVEDVDGAVQDGDALHEFIVRFRGIEERVPAPVNGRQQDSCLEEGKGNVDHGKSWAQRPHPNAHPGEEVGAAVDDLEGGLPLAFVDELNDRADVDIVEEEARDVCDPVEEVVTWLVSVGDHVQRPVAVAMVIDGVTVCEDSRQDTIEHSDPPIDDVAKDEGLVAPSSEGSHEGMPLLVREGVYVGEVHEVGTDA
mmetsp:Transcript_7733/g.20901  ORF Transcript_7733/g.20901 Transcript_7733/m.20901 type:complete len:269 (+) Transcript_7733:330-1136(+)